VGLTGVGEDGFGGKKVRGVRVGTWSVGGALGLGLGLGLGEAVSALIGVGDTVDGLLRP
jgi:hypothetical protein